jgi:hypothetical protein
METSATPLRRDLVHVDGGARVEHRPPLGERYHRERVRLADRGQACPVDRVHGDVARGTLAVAHRLAVVEHRRFVLLALADHDDAVHRDRIDHQAHRVHGGLVGADLVTAPDPPAGGKGSRLGHAYELERAVPVGSLVHRGRLLGSGAG